MVLTGFSPVKKGKEVLLDILVSGKHSFVCSQTRARAHAPDPLGALTRLLLTQSDTPEKAKYLTKRHGYGLIEIQGWSRSSLQTETRQQMHTIKLTDKQIDAIYSAINIFRGSYDGVSEEEMRDWGINPIMATLRQVEAKLDNATEVSN
jgi:hypothetical protein